MILALLACQGYPPKHYLDPCKNEADCPTEMRCLEFEDYGARCTFDCSFSAEDSGLNVSVCPLNDDGVAWCVLGTDATTEEPFHGCVDKTLLDAELAEE